MNRRFRTIALSLLFLFQLTQAIFADGFIVVPHPPRIHQPTLFPLEVKYHHVDVEIDGKSAVTSIDQEFYNPNQTRLEGLYIFPIPKGAVIKKFSMYINGKETKAELLDAKKARKIYEDIVRRELDPAILEYEGLDIFKARIFPIEPRSTKRIKISYNELLNRDNGNIEYMYPLNTEKFSSKLIKDVTIKVNIQSQDNIKNIYCPSHEVDIIRKSNKHAIVSYEDMNVKPDTDFKLYYNTDMSLVGLSILTYRGSGKDGYFFLNASPGYDHNEVVSEKDITFVLDVSGSMAGKKLKKAKRALEFCIENLNKGDRFQIIRFSTEADALFNGLEIADNTNRKKAINFIENLSAIGGTHIEEALGTALSSKTTTDSRPYIIIFITDGKPTIGERDEDKLVTKIKGKNVTNTRIFTFGIGYDINTHLLDKIANSTRAYKTYISPKEDIELKISNFYTKVKSPVLTDIRLKFGNNLKVSKTYPKMLPDLFRGSSLTVIGQYIGAGDNEIIIEGNIQGRKQIFKYNAHFSKNKTKNDFIPMLWAARRIGHLLDEIRLNGEDKELVEEVTHLAREFGIVTPYTSYLILEDERRKVSSKDLEDKNQTLGAVAPNTPEFAIQSKKEYTSMKRKSGEQSVQASTEFQSLNNATNFTQTRQGKKRLFFRNMSGEVKNINQQVKNIMGRAVYYTGKFWVDSKLQDKKGVKEIRIKFAGKKYFNLLRNNSDYSEFFALGRNVRFIMGNTIYEIYE